MAGVPRALEQTPVQRVHEPGETVERPGPGGAELAVEKLLRLPQILEREEDVVGPLVPEARGVHPPGQPLPPVEAHLHREGEPGLDADVAEAEVPVHEVEVVVQALAAARDQLETLRVTVPVDVEGQARLHRGEQAKRPRLHRVLPKEVPRDLLLAPRRRRQVPRRNPEVLHPGADRLLETRRQALGPLPELLEQHPLHGQDARQARHVGELPEGRCRTPHFPHATLPATVCPLRARPRDPHASRGSRNAVS